MKISRRLLGWFIIIQFGCLHAQSCQSKIEVIRITDQIYKLFLNDVDLVYVNLIAYLSDEGILLVDTGLEGSAPEVQKVLKGLRGGKIRYIINTHSDGDHTLGNPLLGKDAIIIAHESCREEMKRDERYPDEWLPILTMKDELTIHFGNEVIHLVAMPCHTEGDIIVHFQKANILCVGDIIFSNSFPTIHLEKNGNLNKLIQVFQDLQRMFPPETRVIIGHGEDMTIGDIAEYEKMTTETIAAVRKAMQKKISIEQLKNNEILKAWRSWESPLFEELDCDLWIQNIFDFYEKKYETNPEEFPALKGPYLGQKPPGIKAELFAPGIVSTGMNELSICCSPNGKEIYFHVTGPTFRPRFFLITRLKDTRWTKPREVSFFSQKREDAYPFVAPDGKKLFFCSTRPPSHHREIWFVDILERGWSKPTKLDFGGEFRGSGVYPTVAANGNLYFNIGYQPGQIDIFLSRYTDGEYSEPEKLSNAINSDSGEFHPFIAPDESYILFDSNRTDDSFGNHDIFISFRDENGNWTEAQNLGEAVNTEHEELRPFASYDGKYLFFVSTRMNIDELSDTPYTHDEVRNLLNSPANGLQDIYWISAEVITRLKPE